MNLNENGIIIQMIDEIKNLEPNPLVLREGFLCISKTGVEIQDLQELVSLFVTFYFLN